MTQYRELEVNGVMVTLKDEQGEVETVIPLRQIVAISVNWLVEGGELSIFTARVGSRYVATFHAGDAGQACADAISDLFRGMEALEQGGRR